MFTRTRSLYYKYNYQSPLKSPVEIIKHAAHGLLSEWANLNTRLPVKPWRYPLENAVDRSNGSSRPVLFVCQSLGGPVVEEVCRRAPVKPSIIDFLQALLLSELEEDLHALSRKTFGIV